MTPTGLRDTGVLQPSKDPEVSQIKYSVHPFSELNFERVYEEILPNKMHLKLSVRKICDCEYIDPWSWTGILTQIDGKQIVFDPDNPADQIIRPDVLELVNPAIKQIKKHFLIDSKHEIKSFIDQKGNTWVLKDDWKTTESTQDKQ
jgi:hypothetical protein